METIHLDFDDNTAMVMLNHGVTNALSPQVVSELAEVLESVRDHSNVKALVLTSTSEKFFSIGFDLPKLIELSETDLRNYYQSFNRLCIQLYSLPKPTVAAIPGHAIAGGCILALCCDYRFIAEGRKLMGLNEVKLGVPVPYPATCILQQLVGTRYSREIVEAGEFFLPETLLQMGLIDRVLHLEKVLPTAIEMAKGLAAHPPEALAMIKRNRVEPVVEQIQGRLEEREQIFVEQWRSAEAQKRLREATKTF